MFFPKAKLYFSSILVFFVVFISVPNALSQKYSAQTCIEMWKDKKQYPQQEIINDLFFNFDSVKAITNLKYFEDYALKKSDPEIMANALIYKTYYIIRIFKLDENFDALTAEILQTIKKAYPLKDDNLIAWLYFLYAEINLRKDRVEESLFFNLKATEIFEKLPYEAFPEKSNIYHSITRALFFGRDYEQAILYGLKCEDALKVERKMISPTRIYNCDYMIVSYLSLKKTKKAEHYIGELRKVIDSFKFGTYNSNEIWRGVYFSYYGQLELQKGNHATALDYFYKALDLVEANNDTSNIISVKTNIGKVLYEQNFGAKALNEWLEVLKISEQYVTENPQSRTQLVNILRLLADYYHVIGNNDEAYRFNVAYNRHSDMLEEQVQNASVKVAKIKLRNEFLYNELERYSSDLKTEKTLRLVILLISVLIIVSILYVLFTTRKQNQLKNEMKEIEHSIVKENLLNAEKKVQDFKKLVTAKNNLISELSATLPDELSKTAKDKLRKYTILTDEDWNEFRLDFSKTHPMFFSILKNYSSDFTPAMLRLSALIFLELSNEEIANSLGIDKASVSRSIRRLRTVLKLNADEDLLTWLQLYYSAETAKI